MAHYEIPPVIRRDWTEEDTDADVESVLDDKTEFLRGMGQTGQRVEHVSGVECLRCGHDEMVRHTHVNPTERNGVAYWCLNPSCQYFVSDELSWATKPHPNMVPDEPMSWQQTFVCPDCDERLSKTVERHSPLHRKVEEAGDQLPNAMCAECKSGKTENEVHECQEN